MGLLSWYYNVYKISHSVSVRDLDINTSPTKTVFSFTWINHLPFEISVDRCVVTYNISGARDEIIQIMPKSINANSELVYVVYGAPIDSKSNKPSHNRFEVEALIIAISKSVVINKTFIL